MKKQLQISLVGTFNQLMIAKNVLHLKFKFYYEKMLLHHNSKITRMW